MKKLLSSALAFVLGVSMLLAVTACSSKHPIAEFKEKMDKENNYEVAVTMEIMGMSITMTTQIDGNIEYTPGGGLAVEMYTETTDDGTYVYTKGLTGKWTKEKTDVDIDTIDDEAMTKLFDPENYEDVEDKKNTYKLKSDVEIEGIADVIMTVDKDTCTLELNIVEGELKTGASMTISKVGEIKLSLPTVE